jgi:choline/ethanolamine kinase
VFGAGTGEMIDRKAEAIILDHLGPRGLCPGVLAAFEWGRVEQWWNSREVTTAEMQAPDVTFQVASMLGSMHSLVVPHLSRKPALAHLLSEWMDRLDRLGPRSVVRQHGSVTQSVDLDALRQTVSRVTRMVSDCGSPIVFCHNDLQEGNILRCHADGALRFVDFEYASYNYRGYDIANHWCEMRTVNDASTRTGYLVLPADKGPSLAFKQQWLHHYLCALQGSAYADATETAQCGERDKLLAEVEVCMHASHVFWGVWALLMAARGGKAAEQWRYVQCVCVCVCVCGYLCVCHRVCDSYFQYGLERLEMQSHLAKNAPPHIREMLARDTSGGVLRARL